MNIAIIGLGYVGLPLAIEFSKKYKVLGFDISKLRVTELNDGFDHTMEADLEELKIAKELQSKNNNLGLTFSNDKEDLRNHDIYIVTVPTPINKFNQPDLSFLLKASEMLGAVISRGAIIIFESTTYPGCTEEDCVPVIEEFSGLKINQDFFAGYSPERINPGDKVNTLTRIKKVTSGSTPQVAEIIDDLYSSIIEAGTFKASSIRVAEASKIIENAQRDLNISFVNELALIFDRMGIDTNDVLDAAETKWNFLRYRPGLVGGHCISVDPYYLTSKSESLGYIPKVILSGRHVNNSIAPFIAQKVIQLMIQNDHKIKNSNVLILGFTFKENCPDIRNTKVIDIYKELKKYHLNVDILDPLASKDEVFSEFGINLLDSLRSNKQYQAIIVAVAHTQFLSFNFESYFRNGVIIFDLKAIIDRRYIHGRL